MARVFGRFAGFELGWVYYIARAAAFAANANVLDRLRSRDGSRAPTRAWPRAAILIARHGRVRGGQHRRRPQVDRPARRPDCPEGGCPCSLPPSPRSPSPSRGPAPGPAADPDRVRSGPADRALRVRRLRTGGRPGRRDQATRQASCRARSSSPSPSRPCSISSSSWPSSARSRRCAADDKAPLIDLGTLACRTDRSRRPDRGRDRLARPAACTGS